MKLEVYNEQPQEETVKLRLMSFGKGVRVVKVNDKGEYGIGDVLLEIYPKGVRRVKGVTDSRFSRTANGRLKDISLSPVFRENRSLYRGHRW